MAFNQWHMRLRLNSLFNKRQFQFVLIVISSSGHPGDLYYDLQQQQQQK